MYRKNVAGQAVYAVLIDATTGAAVTSGASADVSKDGASSLAGTGTLAHISNGLWSYTFAQAETNATVVGFVIYKAGCVPVGGSIRTAAANPDDATAFGLANLSVATSALLTSAGYAAPLTAAGIRDAIGMDEPDMDDQLGDILAAAEVGGSAAPFDLDVGAVADGTSDRVFTSTSGTLNPRAGAYNSQSIRFTSGSLAGEQRTVRSHAYDAGAHTFTLAAALSAAPQAGDEFAL